MLEKGCQQLCAKIYLDFGASVTWNFHKTTLVLLTIILVGDILRSAIVMDFTNGQVSLLTRTLLGDILDGEIVMDFTNGQLSPRHFSFVANDITSLGQSKPQCA